MAKKIELTNENQKHSKEYYEKIKQVLEASAQYQSRKEEAEVKLEELKARLLELNGQIAVELDPKKLEKLGAERKNMRFDIEDLKDLVSVDIGTLMHSKWSEMKRDKVVGNSSNEYHEFNAQVLEEIGKVEAEYKAKLKELEDLRDNHIYHKATSLSQRVLGIMAKRNV
ncbi:MAG: hypothetical protein Q8S24_00040 [Eubacteriales bacterium]|nr:hypothetical protein [Eubacteriales bacterium]